MRKELCIDLIAQDASIPAPDLITGTSMLRLYADVNPGMLSPKGRGKPADWSKDLT